MRAAWNLTHRRIVTVTVLLCGGGLPGCESRPGTAAPVAAANAQPPARAVTPPQPLTAPRLPVAARTELGDGVQRTSSWIDALAKKDLQALVAQTAFPFQIHDTGAEGHCPPVATAAAPEEMAAVMECLLTDEGFTGVLREHETGGFDPLTRASVQPAARAWRDALQPQWKLVTGYFSRPDAFVEVDLAVAEEGVRAVWKTGMDGRREAELARRWIAALRSEDIEALTHLTTYPFELRDRGRHAGCGTRSTAKAEELGAKLACLFGNKVLHQALLDSTESPAIVARADGEPPQWVASWLRGSRAVPSTRVSMLVGTPSGEEFDLQLLLTETGVRAVYKSGSFEATD